MHTSTSTHTYTYGIITSDRVSQAGLGPQGLGWEGYVTRIERGPWMRRLQTFFYPLVTYS